MDRSPFLRILLCTLLFEITVSAQPQPIKSNDKIYVGFLDDAREEMVNWKPGVARNRVVRPAFERTTSGWKEVDLLSLPPRLKWTIVFDGRNIGQVESQGNEGGGLTAFQTILTPAVAVPKRWVSLWEFAGLLDGGGETKVRRPLIVVSKPYFRDPDGWQRTQLPDEVRVLVRKAFRRQYSHVFRCKDEKIVVSNWNFPDSALNFPVAYASNKTSFLVETDLNAGDCGYVDDPDDPNSGPWFFVAPGGAVRRIGSFMSLLDAGDYDGDGQSEVVFFLSQGENTDGFVLYDATFAKPITLTWHYH